MKRTRPTSHAHEYITVAISSTGALLHHIVRMQEQIDRLRKIGAPNVIIQRIARLRVRRSRQLARLAAKIISN